MISLRSILSTACVYSARISGCGSEAAVSPSPSSFFFCSLYIYTYIHIYIYIYIYFFFFFIFFFFKYNGGSPVATETCAILMNASVTRFKVSRCQFYTTVFSQHSTNNVQLSSTDFTTFHVNSAILGIRQDSDPKFVGPQTAGLILPCTHDVCLSYHRSRFCCVVVPGHCYRRLTSSPPIRYHHKIISGNIRLTSGNI